MRTVLFQFGAKGREGMRGSVPRQAFCGKNALFPKHSGLCIFTATSHCFWNHLCCELPFPSCSMLTACMLRALLLTVQLLKSSSSMNCSLSSLCLCLILLLTVKQAQRCWKKQDQAIVGLLLCAFLSSSHTGLWA